MPGFIKQSTGVVVSLGPFVDAVDGFNVETGLLLSTCSLAAIRKHNSLSTQTISMRTLSHVAFGFYSLSLAASDVDTLGQITICIVAPNVARPWVDTFMVVPANAYDALVNGSDPLDVNVSEIGGNAAAGFLSGTDKLAADIEAISGDTTAAESLEAALEAVVVGTAQSGSSTTSIITDLTEATNDHYNGRRLVWRSGALAGQACDITDYNGSSKTLTVTALTEAPANGDLFAIV
jgi:hypothetical protein